MTSSSANNIAQVTKPTTKTMCTDQACPLTLPHEAGKYNIRILAPEHEERRIKKLPPVVRNSLQALLSMNKTRFGDITPQEWDTATKLTKFAIAHDSQGKLLDPKLREKLIMKHHNITSIFKKNKPAATSKPAARVDTVNKQKPTPTVSADKTPIPALAAAKAATAVKPGRPTRRHGPGRGDKPFTKPLSPFKAPVVS